MYQQDNNGQNDLIIMELRESEVNRRLSMKLIATLAGLSAFFFFLYFITVAGINRNSSGMVFYLLVALIIAGILLVPIRSFSNANRQIRGSKNRLQLAEQRRAGHSPPDAEYCINCGNPLAGARVFCHTCGFKQ